MRLKVENYDRGGNKINIQKVVLQEPLIYVLLKRYLKEN